MIKNKKLSKFTFIVVFRGGTYCTQVKAASVNQSILQWIKQLKKEQDQIQFLGDKVIDELKKEYRKDYNIPVPLTGLKNIWFTGFATKMGHFHINIVKTVMA